MLNFESDFQFQIKNIVSNDIDELCEKVAPWDLYLEKLDRRTSFFGGVQMLQTKSFVIALTDFGNILNQTGFPPKGMRTFWLPMDDKQHLIWRNLEIKHDNIGVFPSGGELHAVTREDFRICVVSISEEILMVEAGKMGIDWRSQMVNKNDECLFVEPQIIVSMRELIRQMFKLDHFLMPPQKIQIGFQSLQKKIVKHFILNCLNMSKNQRPELSNRLRIFNKFKEYLDAFPQEPFSSSDLCSFTGASERTLQYVIKDYTRLTPNQYAKAIKLNMIRQKLKNGKLLEKTISQIAFENGFWHAAQFSADYKRQFGELPSETLKK